ncbi:hypothetical protein N7489_011429 [Penicillium chrysogenum]|uniref:Uncharacterized protein n=1 Tax=Penicillium chrysogenum TaxID=5076 RepID=A0ABQ8W1L2_PENCH|nr:uncharacterized protein N7489_011429 [Penicillium chrysogenum]KAJ5230721.1 hypothetical protein N7489_011429 [Penicillium chrysogenum]KAJ5254596.1 hypothetical protein N7505_011805 [Penicillium chrysogenum]KAJ5268196.1 hypothetical protein N7524_005655 [Penicillium chrysogenum]KAJ6163045.1 hypothetical protein N7497_003024 [Penicillium chrysogenum]
MLHVHTTTADLKQLSPGQPSKITGIQSIVYGVASGFLQLPGFLFPISSSAHAAFTRAPERDMVT